MKTIIGVFLVVGGMMIGAFMFNPSSVDADLVTDDYFITNSFHCGENNDMAFLEYYSEEDKALIQTEYNNILLNRGITEEDLDNNYNLRIEVRLELIEFIKNNEIVFENEYYPSHHGMWH